MNKILIYKITRSDKKEYIGQTIENRLSCRMNCHKISDRFKDYTFYYEILDSSVTQEEADYLEELYIQKYDTYHNGLNKTISGKGNHKSSKFTTKGWKMPEDVKAKISEKLKGKPAWNKNKPWDKKTRERFSKVRKGKCYRPTKLTWEIVDNIREDYKAQKWINNFSELIGVVKPNGRKETYDNLFSKKYAEILNTTQQNITSIIKNKTWMRERE